jgi:hypothetical protein
MRSPRGTAADPARTLADKRNGLTPGSGLGAIVAILPGIAPRSRTKADRWTVSLSRDGRIVVADMR